jgi:hypothetical protein
LIEEIKDRRVLFAALNWGMGHVSRSIPLLGKLQEQGNEIFLCCDETQRKVFEEYLCDVTYIHHNGYPFSHSGKGNFAFDLWKSRQALFVFLQKEREWVRLQTSLNNIDLVLSDHRYGFVSDTVESIFITHQLNLPIPMWQKPVQWLHNHYISRFTKVWVMDDPRIKLSGKLGRIRNSSKQEYIGLWSRFSDTQQNGSKEGAFGLINGPEVYANQMKSKLEALGIQIIQGDNWQELDKTLLNVREIHCRGGYSTRMDAYYLGSIIVAYPTPGQGEQEYLNVWNKKNPLTNRSED